MDNDGDARIWRRSECLALAVDLVKANIAKPTPADDLAAAVVAIAERFVLFSEGPHKTSGPE